MQTRPIIFSAPMVRALLDGTKTQTRRIIKPPHLGFFNQRAEDQLANWADRPMPYGRPGDMLWVREPYSDTSVTDVPSRVYYRADYPDGFLKIRWKPSIHMPRWASRITLGITGVRVERLQRITVSDALAEGYDGSVSDPVDPSIKWYADLFDKINGPGSWDKNPLVWVIKFKVHRNAD
jgi:hypothetical protein